MTFWRQLEQDVSDNLIAMPWTAHEQWDYPTVHFIEKEMLEEQTTALKYMNDLVRRLQPNEKNSTIVVQMMDQDSREKQLKKPSYRRIDFICFSPSTSCSKNILYNLYEINQGSQWRDTQSRKSLRDLPVYMCE